MDWNKLISELEAGGLTQTEIAERCGCSQPYVSQLKAGLRASPAFDIGSALTALHEAQKSPSRRSSAA